MTKDTEGKTLQAENGISLPAAFVMVEQLNLGMTLTRICGNRWECLFQDSGGCFMGEGQGKNILEAIRSATLQVKLKLIDELIQMTKRLEQTEDRIQKIMELFK